MPRDNHLASADVGFILSLCGDKVSAIVST